MKTTYKGITTELTDNLLDKPIIYKTKPRKTNKFGTLKNNVP